MEAALQRQPGATLSRLHCEDECCLCRDAAGSVIARWGWPAPELGSPLDPHHPSPPHASPLPAAWHEPQATQRLLAALQSAMLPPLLEEDASATGAVRSGFTLSKTHGRRLARPVQLSAIDPDRSDAHSEPEP